MNGGGFSAGELEEFLLTTLYHKKCDMKEILEILFQNFSSVLYHMDWRYASVFKILL